MRARYHGTWVDMDVSSFCRHVPYDIPITPNTLSGILHHGSMEGRLKRLPIKAEGHEPGCRGGNLPYGQ